MECLVYHTVDKIGMGKGRIKKTVFHVLNKTKQQQAMISLHFIGDKRMRNLNLAHRGKDKVTDVLAFSTKDGCGIKHKEEKDLGDIIICIPQVRRQAKEYKVSFQEEFLRIVIHGVLHLVGHDHIKKADARKMFSLQEKLVKDLL